MFTHDLEIEPFRKTSKTIRGNMHTVFHPAGLFSGLFLLYLATTGCGGKSSTRVCKLTAISVSPRTATVDHTIAPPGNTQHFDGFDSSSTPGCFAVQGNLTTTIWLVSDTTNINIGNVHDATYGVATCRGATTGAATVTATVPDGDGTNVTNTASPTCC
jgi:hypothetical protein